MSSGGGGSGGGSGGGARGGAAARGAAVARGAAAARRARVDVVFNAVAGSGDGARDLRVVRRELARSFARVLIWHTTASADGRQQAADAIADGAVVLVACGGDGTVSAVATAIHAATQRQQQQQQQQQGAHAPRLVLGVIARGTANALCHALHIPTALRAGARLVARGGAPRRVDLPLVRVGAQSRRMLLLAGIGLEAAAVSRTARRMKRLLGPLAYAICGVASIWRQPRFTAAVQLTAVSDSVPFAGGRLRADAVSLSALRLVGVTVVNAAPPTSVLAHGIGRICPDDALLELVCVRAAPPRATLRTLLAMLRAALLRERAPLRCVFGLRAAAVRVECSPPQRVVVDGEFLGFTPIVVELKQPTDCIHVLAPKAGTVNRRARRLSRALVRLWRNARGVALLALAVAILRRSPPHPRHQHKP